MRMTKPMRRALRRIVKNETLGARNPFNYNTNTLFALIRRRLAVFSGVYIVPTGDGMAFVEREDRS